MGVHEEPGRETGRGSEETEARAAGGVAVMTAVQVRGLTKTFGRTTAVRAVSFSAPAGKITGFLGPNGSGKPVTGL
jgi:ABC-type uncharacterized transport system ATPase subunit